MEANKVTDSLLREIVFVHPDFSDISAMRRRYSGGTAYIEVKFAGQSIEFLTEDYETFARAVLDVLRAACDDPCNLPNHDVKGVPDEK